MPKDFVKAFALDHGQYHATRSPRITFQLAQDRTDGLSYDIVFKGTDSRITSDILLPASQRIDVSTATDMQIVQEVAMCIAQYMADLQFKQDNYMRYVASPYDLFLNKNHLPRVRSIGETPAAYNQLLYSDVLALSNPVPDILGFAAWISGYCRRYIFGGLLQHFRDSKK